MRLAKFLADAGIASRRKAEKLIDEGRVKVNGIKVIEQGYKIDSNIDKVEFDNQVVQKEEKKYIVLYKPGGYISSVYDPQGRPTVRELVTGINLRLYPVGRLDFDTEGILLLTNDGDFTNLMIHPRYEIKKKYEALVEGHAEKADIDNLRKGIMLDDGMTAPANVQIIKSIGNNMLLGMEIHEGRKRQVKRMCAAVNHPVISLKRTAFAFLTLKGLSPGEYRYLTSREVEELKKLAIHR
ncbi:MAG: pseudouridine synthase [Syntrophomonadaceae bacterium]|nr:pseudouridine synthase [Syntrophomonadaceae bacterium]MDD3888538.1 pseudouridine synthase [Syntrophomonadaceae bacterium]MDD4548619.1 pseudouridine synthase [Syntrophomonadaceae bacterium]